MTIDDAVIEEWVDGLPTGGRLHLVSLLGTKRSGNSEFSCYPYRSETESNEKPSWDEWMKARYGDRFDIHEFPTVDRMGIPAELMSVVIKRIEDLLRADEIVVVVDSAGAERTARVCEALGYDLELPTCSLVAKRP